MREEGYYWVKEDPEDNWIIAHYSCYQNPIDSRLYCSWSSSDHWTGDFEDADLFKINETRILPPQN